MKVPALTKRSFSFEVLRLAAAGIVATVFLTSPTACSGTQVKANAPLYEELLFREKGPRQKTTARHPAEVRDEQRRKALQTKASNSHQKQKTAPPLPDEAEESLGNWLDFLADLPSRSIGKASRGSLSHGRFLPKKGVGYRRKNDKAAYGTDESIAIVLWACLEISRLYPGTVPVVIGDLSTETGGKLRPHSSYQSGRDVDIGYYFTDNRPVRHFMTATSKNLDIEKTWTFFELLLSTDKIQYMFVDYRVQRYLFREAQRRGWQEDELSSLFEAPLGARKKGGIIRHIRGHRHHVHVRFHCPEGDTECR